MIETKEFKTYTLRNFTDIPQLRENLTEEQMKVIQVVGTILPFKVNNYIVDELIDWNNFEMDPIFILTFPQKGMLKPEDYKEVEDAINAGIRGPELKLIANKIRQKLNPNPAGQMEHNVPIYNGERLDGVQHKYEQTLLFFPSHGQTCHAYCTFCFRWPQFIGSQDLKFARKETDMVIKYIEKHPKISDVLITGGDPMTMSAERLRAYIEPFLKLEQIRNIRIGTKSLAYWPYKFVNDSDAEDVLQLFRDVVTSGKQLAFMAHFNHPNELATPILEEAVANIRATGAQIRTQSPIMRHINDNPCAWRDMWKKQVQLGMIPYYMFLARDTGAREYFSVSLVRAWNIYRDAYKQVSGIARTVRGPSMSAHPGKVGVLGPVKIEGKKYLALNFIQGRNSDWVNQPFFAKFDENAEWLDDLKPAFGQEHFFFETELIDDVKLN